MYFFYFFFEIRIFVYNQSEVITYNQNLQRPPTVLTAPFSRVINNDFF